MSSKLPNLYSKTWKWIIIAYSVFYKASIIVCWAHLDECALCVWDRVWISSASRSISFIIVDKILHRYVWAVPGYHIINRNQKITSLFSCKPVFFSTCIITWVIRYWIGIGKESIVKAIQIWGWVCYLRGCALQQTQNY